MKRFKIIGLYLLSLICIFTFFILHNSKYLSSLIEKAKDFRTNGFFIFLVSGLIEYGLLLTGIFIIIVLTYFLVKKNAT
ncbi:hypothetical protein JM79_2048 [Gramella sp. Hel_I_59]|nr:hypothetical protein JM79_2048 [Gramella sp. Hel_I_59]